MIPQILPRRIALSLPVLLLLLIGQSHVPAAISAPANQLYEFLNLPTGQVVSRTVTFNDAYEASIGYTAELTMKLPNRLNIRHMSSGSCDWSGIVTQGGWTEDIPDGPRWAPYLLPASNDQISVRFWPGSGTCGSSFPQRLLVEFYVGDSPPSDSSPDPEPPPPPDEPRQAEISFEADSDRLKPGQCTTLRWTVENVNGIYLDGKPVTGPTGNQQACPSQTTTYTLEVDTAQGRVTRQVTIVVDQPRQAQISFGADPDWIQAGECSTLRWTVENVNAIRLEGQGVTGPTGSQQVCPAWTTTYTLEVDTDQGRVSRQATVTVAQPPTSTATATRTATPTSTSTRQATATSTSTRQATATSTATRQATATSTSTRQATATSTSTPPPVKYFTQECENEKLARPVILMTDSIELDARLGPGAWEELKALLFELYKSRAVECRGYPLFFDAADLHGDRFWDDRKAWVIEDALGEFIRERTESLYGPHSIAIIGGETVIPSYDRGYGSFGIDKDNMGVYTHYPVTRLPDGGSLSMMKNYIAAFQKKPQPEPGMTAYTNFIDSLDRTTIGFTGALRLSDLMKPRPGNFYQLLSPPWGEKIEMGAAAALIPPDDDLNRTYVNGNTPLNTRDLLFILPVGAQNYVWLNVNPVTDKLAQALHVEHVKNWPGEGGWHIFTTAAMATYITDNQRPENSITLQFLNRGAHHVIGSNNNNSYDTDAIEWVEGLAAPISQYSLKTYSGRLIQLYYSLDSDDPAYTFWRAKNMLYQEWYEYKYGNRDPYLRDTLDHFQYFGLPEGGRVPTVTELPGAVITSDLDCPSHTTTDCDGDGMRDDIEHQLAEEFRPYLYFDKDEPARYMYAYWQVTPVKNSELAGVPIQNGAIATFVMAYQHDYGGSGASPWKPWTWGRDSGQTNGDIEAVRFLLYYGGSEPVDQLTTVDPKLWAINYIDYARDQNGFWQAAGSPMSVSDAIANEGLNFSGSHPILYVAHKRHTLYPSRSACSEHESCNPDFNQQPQLIPTSPKHNVGERPDVGGYPLLDWLPEYRTTEAPERAWGPSSDNFCGGCPLCMSNNHATCTRGMAGLWFPDDTWMDKYYVAPSR